MCPACISTVALIVAGAIPTGGLTALVRAGFVHQYIQLSRPDAVWPTGRR